MWDAYVVLTEGEWKFIDYTGQNVCNQSFEEADDFSEGIAVVRKFDGELTLLTEKGELITCYAKVVFQFRNGKAVALKKWHDGLCKKR